MPASTTVGLVVGLIATGAVLWAQENEPRKKLIAVGWDIPNAEPLRANLAVMERRPL